MALVCLAALLLLVLIVDGGARLEAAGAGYYPPTPTPLPTRVMPGMPTRTPTPRATATRTPPPTLTPGPAVSPTATPFPPSGATPTPSAGPGDFQYAAIPAPSGTFQFNADGSVSWLVNGRPVTVEVCDGGVCKVIRMQWSGRP